MSITSLAVYQRSECGDLIVRHKDSTLGHWMSSSLERRIIVLHLSHNGHLQVILNKGDAKGVELSDNLHRTTHILLLNLPTLYKTYNDSQWMKQCFHPSRNTLYNIAIFGTKEISILLREDSSKLSLLDTRSFIDGRRVNSSSGEILTVYGIESRWLTCRYDMNCAQSTKMTSSSAMHRYGTWGCPKCHWQSIECLSNM